MLLVLHIMQKFIQEIYNFTQTIKLIDNSVKIVSCLKVNHSASAKIMFYNFSWCAFYQQVSFFEKFMLLLFSFIKRLKLTSCPWLLKQVHYFRSIFYQPDFKWFYNNSKIFSWLETLERIIQPVLHNLILGFRFFIQD